MERRDEGRMEGFIGVFEERKEFIFR